MSVEQGKSAELIIAGKGDSGPFWRFVTGEIKSDRIEYQPRDGSDHYSFVWSDADSGKMSQLSDAKIARQGKGARPGYSTVFTRLDG